MFESGLKEQLHNVKSECSTFGMGSEYGLSPHHPGSPRTKDSNRKSSLDDFTKKQRRHLYITHHNILPSTTLLHYHLLHQNTLLHYHLQSDKDTHFDAWEWMHEPHRST